MRTPPPLGPARRAPLLALAFLMLALASPGVLTRGGSPWLALAALSTWAAVAHRPGRFAAWIEWGVGTLAWAWICSWAAYVWWGTMLVLGPGMGLYTVFSGWALRRLARRVPLALAAPAAWLISEGVRAVLPPPFGFQWMRLGTHLHEVGWIAGSARVWGFGGLALVLASLAGLVADLLRRERPTLAAWIAGLAPTSLALLLGLLVRAPETIDGPTLLLVQPAIPQARKMQGRDPSELFSELVQLTVAGLDRAAREGAPPPDLVCWSETMLPTFIADPGLAEAVDRGARFPPWFPVQWEPADFRAVAVRQEAWVDRFLLGQAGSRGVLPEGTAFLAGAEYLKAMDGHVRRLNSVLLWSGPGEPSGPVSKLFLVPGAETMLGLERYAGVRDAIQEIAGYLPDLESEPDASRTLEFSARDGRTWRLSVAVCFDNAFDQPFTRPLREGPLDFHLVASNEAWFRRSLEFDQMMAFSRLEAIATARSVVRATNSGVSAVLGPDGGEVARLEVGGLDREVRGTLRVRVPVPATRSAAAQRTPFVRLERLWAALWILLPLVLLLATARRPPGAVTPGPAGVPDPAPSGSPRASPGGHRRP